MNPELTRREVLKLGSAVTAASLLGWYVPGGAGIITPDSPDHSDPDAIPEDVNEIVMQFGAVVGISPPARDLLREAERRARSYLPEPPEVEGWIAEECIADRVIETPAGGDHGDPLAAHHLVGVKQSWRMVRA